MNIQEFANQIDVSVPEKLNAWNVVWADFGNPDIAGTCCRFNTTIEITSNLKETFSVDLIRHLLLHEMAHGLIGVPQWILKVDNEIDTGEEDISLIKDLILTTLLISYSFFNPSHGRAWKKKIKHISGMNSKNFRAREAQLKWKYKHLLWPTMSPSDWEKL